MSRTPREILINTARVLREQAEVIEESGDSQDLEESLALVQRAVDELKVSALV